MALRFLAKNAHLKLMIPFVNMRHILIINKYNIGTKLYSFTTTKNLTVLLQNSQCIVTLVRLVEEPRLNFSCVKMCTLCYLITQVFQIKYKAVLYFMVLVYIVLSSNDQISKIVFCKTPFRSTLSHFL